MFIHCGYHNTGLRKFADMWKFNITTFEWAWRGGDQVSLSQGNYGKIGEFSTAYYPTFRFVHRVVLFWDSGKLYTLSQGGDSGFGSVFVSI